jgi:hypothetical protein
MQLARSVVGGCYVTGQCRSAIERPPDRSFGFYFFCYAQEVIIPRGKEEVVFIGASILFHVKRCPGEAMRSCPAALLPLSQIFLEG